MSICDVHGGVAEAFWRGGWWVAPVGGLGLSGGRLSLVLRLAFEMADGGVCSDVQCAGGAWEPMGALSRATGLVHGCAGVAHNILLRGV